MDSANAGHDSSSRRLVLVHPIRGHRRELKERRSGIEDSIDSLPSQHLAATLVPGNRLLATSGQSRLHVGSIIGHDGVHRRSVLPMLIVIDVDLGKNLFQSIEMLPLDLRSLSRANDWNTSNVMLKQ